MIINTPQNEGKEEVTDARFVSVKLQHALIAVPDNTYKTRFDDPCGIFYR